MIDKGKAFQLFNITMNDVADYFYQLGGSGRYSAYQEWHPLAYAAITALKIDLDIYDEVTEKILHHPSYHIHKIFEIVELEKRIKPKIQELECSDFDVSIFLGECNKMLVDSILKRSQKKTLDPMALNELMEWAVFYAEMHNTILPKVNQSRRSGV